ncbi:nucleotidyltransferase domain-containing protein [Flavobacterium oreochromis]|uniref:Nucleotidyltransferase n=2 Tax=Flavobacterium TaxID=237 RepID=A0A2D0AHU2_9FLAO|nr:nucleotidyltransferase domain-containing protein [Flavobacterium oreochromis]OWP75761.1 nucleotidyltransferase [Flavobacterium oreochromis]OWP77677.1 nucleotidyltransferase [Flavobacterium oreochromis]POR24030.1 nucleotidyltransferase [Flavobacterium columnare]QYS87626.1 nucleotidyltransferase domain-containing protein [Flavobacterium oreochromis]
MTIQDLKSQNLILFEVISGSKSFGLDTPTSDTDIKGVFYMPKDKFYGLEYIPQISNETNDIVYYELGRFVELLLKNNPNILEVLASPEDCILYKHPLMNQLKIEDFLSKLCKDTFAGYAITQIKKARGLKKKIVNPMSKERKSLLDFCSVLQGYDSISLANWLFKYQLKQEQCGLINIPNAKGIYALFYDEHKKLGYKGVIKNELSNEVSVSSIPKGAKELGYLSCNLEGYSKYCKEYATYWDWIEKRNEERYETNQLHGKNYDSKNMMHTIRLLQTAQQILETQRLNIRVTNREELLTIKSGAMEYDTLLQKADDLITSIEKLTESSLLPELPNNRAIAILINIRKQLYN